jgi:uncharacterized protein (TIGR03000 family)
MNRQWLNASVITLLSVVGWFGMNPQPAQGQVIVVAAGVWGWRNIVAPEFGGPWVAPEYRFRPLARLRSEGMVRDDSIPASQARITVMVPDPNAQVWINGKLMQATGTQRDFDSPPLEPGIRYSYEIRARWGDGKQAMDQTLTVPIQPGRRAVVDFARTVNR